MADFSCISNFFRRILQDVFEFHVLQIDVIDSFQQSHVVELLFFRNPNAVFVCFSKNIRAWMLPEILLFSAPDHVQPRRRHLVQHRELGDTGPRFRMLPPTVNVPTVVHPTFQQYIQCRLCPPDNIKKLEWDWE